VIAAVIKQAQSLRVRLRGKGLGAVLARGAGGAFAVRILGTGLAFGLQVLLARLMLAEGYGVYIYALSWTTLLAVFGRFGFDTGLVKFVAAYEGRREWGFLRGILHRSWQITFAAGLALALVASFIVWLLRERLAPALLPTFLVSFAMMPFLVVAQIRAAALRGLRRVVIARVPETVFQPIVLAGLAALVYVVRAGDLSPPLVMGLHAAVVAFALLLSCIFLRQALSGEARQAEVQYRTKEWAKVSSFMLLMATMHLVLLRTDVLMIGALVGTTEAGIYAVAVRAATFVLFVLQSINAIAAPMISQLYATNRQDELQRMVTLAARGIFFLTLPVAVGLMLFGGKVLFLFGDEFVAGRLALTILCVGQVINAFAGSVGFLMVMSGHHREAARVVAASACMNIILNAVLIPRFGMRGAACATAMTTVMWKLWMLVLVRRKLGIRSSVLQVI